MELYTNVYIEESFYGRLDVVLDNHIRVFGDNVLRSGKAGQAVIRDCPDSFGIATKFSPTRSPQAYFNDKASETAFNVFKTDIILLRRLAEATDAVLVFPMSGLGTGLSQVPTRAPITFKRMMRYLSYQFPIRWDFESQVFKLQ